MSELGEDPLTKAYDRASFFSILDREVFIANDKGTKLALMIIDIERFNGLNILFGYTVGDKVLQNLVQILASICRKNDYVARIGDNQFALILTGVMNEGHAKLAAYKIQRLLEIPFVVNNEKVSVNASIGISLCPKHASEARALLKKSEEAHSFARQTGQKIVLTKESSSEEISDNWDIELGLKTAIDRSEYKLYYQPKISLTTGKPVGAEALIRWQHSSRGFLPPSVFIPVAEKTGYIKPLTVWVINTALRQSMEWTNRWGPFPLSVSVNIPPDLIIQPDFKDIVENAIKLWPNENVKLVLEITERTLVSETLQSFELLRDIQALGVQISIDDFGTGYSSLSYFKSIPARELKIDQSFVKTLLADKANVKIIKLIIQLAHSFNLTVIGEGVEDYDTLLALKNLGCDDAQGYFIARPMPDEEFREWLEKYQGIKKPIVIPKLAS